MITVILTGGLSRRMGRDKGLLPFGGESLLRQLVERWRDVFDGVAVSVDRPGRFDTAGAAEYTDLHPGCGPFAGLEAALAQSGAEAVFLTAVDLPFGEPALARRIAALRGDADACFIRRKNGRQEPLFGVYAAACLPALTACMEEGRYSGKAMFERVKVREVAEEELPGFDLDRILFNMNRPADLMLAEQMRRMSP